MSNFITKDFEPVSAKAWKQKIQFDLKGANYNETLLSQTNEGITIKPFYHSDDFDKLDIPMSDGDFKTCQKIWITSESQSNQLAIDATNRGANALQFIADAAFEIKEIFDNLLEKNIAFHFKINFYSETFINELVDFLKDEETYYNIDPLGQLAKTGNWFNSFEKDFKSLGNILNKHPDNFIIGIHAGHYQNSGANTVQQVAYALAHANEYLTHFGSEIASKIQFNFAIGGNYFFEIAKIRAFRYLYNLILSEYNTSTSATIFAEPSRRNKTIYDYNVNMLRTTTECMSAILGGSNTISNNSYDAIFHESNEFGERISRNQLLVLKEESYFKDAQHIATDSYYIESITKQIAEKALDIFKDIEKSGGFVKQLVAGTIQRKITENAKKEQAQFDAGELVLLGTNKYPNEQNSMKNDLEVSPFLKKRSEKTLITPIISKRLSEKLEQKRLKDEA